MCPDNLLGYGLLEICRKYITWTDTRYEWVRSTLAEIGDRRARCLTLTTRESAPTIHGSGSVEAPIVGPFENRHPNLSPTYPSSQAG